MNYAHRSNAMNTLTMDIEFSSEILGIEPGAFRDMVKRDNIEGVLKLDQQWRVSIFTLAEILNTSPALLLEFLEDYALGELMDSVDGDDFFEGEEALNLYRAYVAAHPGLQGPLHRTSLRDQHRHAPLLGAAGGGGRLRGDRHRPLGG